jgi:transposase
MNERIFVGVDVNRTCIQVVLRPSGQQWVASVEDSGISETADMLSSVQPEIVVMEAQGGIELSVAGTLATAGLPLAFVSHRKVRDFARSIGRIPGDPNHAGLLAYFAELVQPEVRAVPADLVEQLKSLKARRREMLSLLAVERGRQESELSSIQKDIRSHISYLEKSVAMLSEEINRAVRSSSIWR